MKKRQLKKILDIYLVDEDGETLIPPSIYKEDDKSMEKYFQKAWMISNPEKSKEIQAALEKAYEEAEKHCDCGCGCECDHEHEKCECEGECHCEDK